MVISLIIFLAIFLTLDGVTTWLLKQEDEECHNKLCRFYLDKTGTIKNLVLSRSCFFISCALAALLGWLSQGIGFFVLSMVMALYFVTVINNVLVLNKLYPSGSKNKELV